MLVLRAFLGVTFAYAGMQKLMDPNFLHPGTPDYIGSQLQAFAQGSPIGPVLRILAHLPTLTGVSIALLEIAIGVGTLLGVAAVASAVAGFLVSFTLFLSATWHVHPYFLGSDSVYAVGWVAYLAGLWEAQVRGGAFLRSRVPSPIGSGRMRPAGPGAIGRRELLRGAVLGGATIVLASLAKAVAGAPARSSATGGVLTPSRSGHGSRPGSRTTGPHQSGTKPSPHGSTQGRPIVALDQVPVGGVVGFTSSDGEPAVLVRLGERKVCAFSRICTHAGCEVGWDPSSRLLVCPCHGAEFDPARHAVPVAGPAPTPLPAIRVAIDRRSGDVVLPPPV